jgi:hypothetical protein
MLFIVAMEVFAKLVAAAADVGLLRPLGAPAIMHHCSLYADDVIIFMHPDATVDTKNVIRAQHTWRPAGSCEVRVFEIP